MNYQLCHRGFQVDFIISIGQSIPLNRDTIGATDLLDVPLHNDIAELLVQFDGAADAVSLFTGDQRAAGTAEGVQHDGVAHGRVHDGIGQERNGLHGGMVAVFLRLIKFPKAPSAPEIRARRGNNTVLLLIGQLPRKWHLNYPCCSL